MALDPETLNQLIETVRRFVDERLIPLEHQVAEDDKVPDDLIAEMKDMGLFGLSIPEEYGGLGLTMEEEALVCLELGRTSPAFRSAFGTNVGIGSQGIVIDGTEAQKREYLPKIASGEYVTSFALTEPDAGSDAGSLKTTAHTDGGDYLLNGTKRFITNAPRADILTVMARTNTEIKGAGGISAFIVRRDTPGLSFGKPEKKMGQQGAHISDVIFEDCRVPAENIIGSVEGVGFKTAMKTLDRGRLHLAAVCAGFAERIIETTLAYAIERKQFGQPIAEFQLVQAMLADSKVEAYAARCMTLDAARCRDRGDDVVTQAACCKMFASEMVGRVVDRAVQVHGGNGYIADYGIERMYRDARLFRIYEGTTQIQQLVIARNMIREMRDTM
ncbi:MAG: acyl-CoA dehydrogenase [Rhodospirillaceae bacterium]|nr:acyl-CoA dehydrogenase [Rhodospirillaceae bacterium]MBT5297271.1 acyl-CoA dehydrogenase [Rhodospirillaceae bacterium]MBT5514320.1 acyl-CoA dehydrogenase [Rhodospirillaceae bacterium]MBT6085169.1 acyl-CoA dehydrogenase [Rhodospirillaceae bacterium]MBT6607421.1 acyl-CoA dehydrogenase [Rhodospirillaceae bacterium]